MDLCAVMKRNSSVSFIMLAMILYLVAFLIPAPSDVAFTKVILLALIVPTITALVLVAVMEGRQGLGTFFRQTFRWRTSPKWYLMAIVIGLVVPIFSNILSLLNGRSSTITFTPPSALYVAYPLFALLEDIGWRGFALRRLLDRQSPFIASLIVGLPWGLIHFSLGVVFQPEISPLSWGLAVFASAFPITWIFVRSEGNVLVAALLHASVNMFVGMLVMAIPEAEIYWFLFGGISLVTFILLLIDRQIWFTRPAETHPRDERHG